MAVHGQRRPTREYNSVVSRNLPPSTSPYAIPVFDLMHRPGEMREKALDIVVPEAFGNAVIGVPLGAPMHVDVRLESLHDGILVSADIDVTAVGECVRCLIEVEQQLEVDLQELFAYSVDEAFDYEVENDSVDLEPVVRDAVVLALPFQPVCREECPGLCPQCGVRFLDDPGHGHEAPVDPRWAALAGLEGLTGPSQSDAISPNATDLHATDPHAVNPDATASGADVVGADHHGATEEKR